MKNMTLVALVAGALLSTGYSTASWSDVTRAGRVGGPGTTTPYEAIEQRKAADEALLAPAAPTAAAPAEATEDALMPLAQKPGAATQKVVRDPLAPKHGGFYR